MLSLLAGLLLFIVSVYALLGLVIDYSVDSLSAEYEISIHKAFADELADAEMGNSNSSETENNTEDLLAQLLECTDIAYPVNLTIAESETLNAYASVGGNIVIYTGLLEQLKSENALAFVLAHEIAHFKNRDHLRGLGRAIVFVAISALLGGDDSDVSSLLSPVNSLELAQFSQSRESQADAQALNILNCHYGHIGGATEFFELIAETRTDVDFSFTHYFSSHPEAKLRIENIQTIAEEMNYSVEETQPKPESLSQ